MFILDILIFKDSYLSATNGIIFSKRGDSIKPFLNKIF